MVKKVGKKSMKKTKKIHIIRTYTAGVHVGEVVSRKGKEVVLKNSVRVHRWRGANSLSEMSQTGVDFTYSRISVPCSSVTLTEVIEVLKCTSVAADNLLTSRWGA